MKTPPEPPVPHRREDERPTEEMPRPDTLRPDRRSPETLPLLPGGASPRAQVETPRTFRDGQMVADRYRVLRFVAAGGRGEVYEALDVDLNERVALKCVRQQASEDPKATLRFKREIHLARRITHPNVCRLFDVDYHRSPEFDTDLLFLTMELLPGETLIQALERRGPFGEDEALPIVQQMCDGLHAAHEAGVVHRDFKSDNVILVPSGPGGATRAVITDFGLARADSGTSFASLTATGKVVGTPAYMAPEQIQGDRVDRRADLYALGVVMFEMLTGKLPFVGDSPLSTAIKRLEQAAPSPRVHLPDVDPVWETVILRCLARDPGRRYGTAEEVKRDLLEGSSHRRAFRRSPGWLRVAAGIALTAALVGAGYHAVRSSRKATDLSPSVKLGSQPTATTVRRPVVGVMEFHSLTGSDAPDWHGEALADLLATAVGQLRSVRGMQYDELWWRSREQGLTASRVVDAQSIRRAEPLLTSDILVTGSYLVLDGPSPRTLRLDLRVVRAADGETLGAIGEVGTEDALPELVDRAVRTIAARLELADGAQQWRLREQWPDTPITGMRALFNGRVALRKSDLKRAQKLLLSAAGFMPNQPQVAYELGRVFSRRGQTGAARDAFRKAWALTESGPAELRLQREAAFRARNGEWPRVVEIEQALWGFFPDELDYGLELVVAQIHARRADDARETLSTLRSNFQQPLEAARIDLLEAASPDLGSSSERRAALAKRALEAATGVGAERLAARSRLALAEALRDSDRLDEAAAALAPAIQQMTSLGDVGIEAELSCRLAELQLAGGDRRAALTTAKAVDRVASERGLDTVRRRVVQVLAALGTASGGSDDIGTTASARSQEN